MKKIAIIGECMIELNGEPFGSMRQAYGGDTLNTATYLARVSGEQVQVHYVSALGTDQLSEGMLNAWREDNIHTDLVLQDSHRQPGLYLIQLDQQGERTFLYWRHQSAARYLLQHIDYSRVLSALAQMDMIYLSGISLAILPENDRLKLVNQLIGLAQKGVKVAFDTNYRPALWQSAVETRQIYTALLPYVDLALVTFDDEQALWKDATPQATIERLTQLGVKNIVVKVGKEGAVFRDVTKNSGKVIACEVKNVVDTTSAGDAFNAGFLNGYLQGKDFTGCCQQGNQLAAIVIQHKGAIISRSATQHFLTKFN
ncbi:sugar kinase [Rodentibacter haemolyticus]|uniref:Sugar kinase n=1 Tax=Rodentibacter haemolyticus TaxID=2778911 RepID=A0ABX6UZP8_9PAST|nr:sugar kinase [Rodentibacter haemolyticus]QPB43577.1 sugar kinase [Rodentibacter haemolyticus]